jgi:DNA-binding CsgD family transcriptional regulator
MWRSAEFTLLPRLAELAEASSGQAEWRLAVLEALRSEVYFDDAFWSMGPSTTDKTAQVHLLADATNECWPPFLRHPERYRLQTGMAMLMSRGGAGIDLDMASRQELDRTPLFAEVLRPGGIAVTLTVLPTFRGGAVSCISFGRRGRRSRFGAHDLEFMQRAVRTLGVLEAAFQSRLRPAAGATGSRAALSSLAPQERKIAEFIASGLSTKEIAGLLGTSPYTVRNQTSQVYKKLGFSGRARLASFAAAANESAAVEPERIEADASL